MRAGNLLINPPTSKEKDERFDVLLSEPGVRIERIISTGQASPPGFWYDQEGAEWVMLLKGAATLQFDNQNAEHPLETGDWVYIAPHQRHRVAWIDPDQITVWLAVHISV